MLISFQISFKNNFNKIFKEINNLWKFRLNK